MIALSIILGILFSITIIFFINVWEWIEEEGGKGLNQNTGDVMSEIKKAISKIPPSHVVFLEGCEFKIIKLKP